MAGGMKKLLIISGALLYTAIAQAQTGDAAIRKANVLYKKGEFKEASALYQKALESNPDAPVPNYNLGNALFRNNEMESAGKYYDNSIQNSTNTNFKGRSYYNKGVSLTKSDKLVESIEAYKQALILNPNDADARHNLQKALFELKKRQPPPPQPNNQPQKKQQQQQQNKQQSKLNKRQVENLLRALQQKEEAVQRKMQSNKRAASQTDKDW
jgi:Ca-activated chloride channel homolog